jgi:glycosyltransferase involved in cell wall biosynthesis
MKIIQIGTFPLDISCIQGGVEASVYGLAKEQAKTNEVYVIDMPRQTLCEDSEEVMDNINVFRYANKKKNNNGAIGRIGTIVKQIKEIEPDICHIHATNPFSFFLLRQLKLNKIKTIVTVHGLSHIEKRNQWNNKKTLHQWIKYMYFSIFEFLILSSVKKIIVDTEYVELEIKKYRQQRKIWRMPICKVIPQGIDKRYFEVPDNDVSDVFLLSVGAINRRKGHLFLVEAMKTVNEKLPNTKLSIVGVKNDEKYYKEISEKIKTLQLDNVISIKTDVSFDELLNYYSQSTIFVLHSEEESQGIVFCEAMAAGKPIVATNVGGIPFVVKQEENGFLSNYKDTNTFAKNIIHLLQNKEEREQMSQQNKIEACQYNWANISNAVMDEYQSIC